MHIKQRFGFAVIGVFWSLLAAYPAGASPIIEGDFNITFTQLDPAGGATWSGMFSTDSAGNVTSFMAEIGVCATQAKCIYTDVLSGIPLPTWDGLLLTGDIVSGASGALLVFFLNEATPVWATLNNDDTPGTRSGE